MKEFVQQSILYSTVKKSTSDYPCPVANSLSCWITNRQTG